MNSTLSVAVVYLGRFYSDDPHPRSEWSRPASRSRAYTSTFGRDWRENHVRNLVQPNEATVLVVGNVDSWCGASDEMADALVDGRWDVLGHEFDRAARAAWEAVGWRKVRTAFFRDERPGKLFSEMESVKARLTTARTRAGLPWSSVHNYDGYIYRWFHQYRSVAQTKLWMDELLSYDLIIRARTDVLFEHPIHLWEETRLAARSADLLALKTCDGRLAKGVHMRGINTTMGPLELSGWNDWIYVGTREAWRVLSQMIWGDLCVSPPSITRDARGNVHRTMVHGYGLFPEEQTALQFAYRGLAVQPLRWNVTLVRPGRRLTAVARTLEGNSTCNRQWAAPLTHFGGAHCVMTGIERDSADPCVSRTRKAHALTEPAAHNKAHQRSRIAVSTPRRGVRADSAGLDMGRHAR